MRTRALVLLGTALAAVSLGLPWHSALGPQGQLISYTYVTFCNSTGCTTTVTPIDFIPGTQSVARFFILDAIALALVGGLYLSSARALRWAAYVGVAGVLLHLAYGLAGGPLALLAASVCFWLAARATAAQWPGPGDVGVTG